MKIRRNSGFTIVELLIVIVVIGILAAIIIVAYNGIQTRAMTTRIVTDLTTVNKYIQNYYAINGSYPVQSSDWGSSTDMPGAYVPGIVPSIASNLPTPPYPSGGGDRYTQAYLYLSNGTDYKLIANGGQYDTLCETVKAQNSSLADPYRNNAGGCWAFGYWSPGAANW